MEPIHQAAWGGDVAAIDRLVAEDGGRLNAPNQQEDLGVEGYGFGEWTLLMLAAYRGQDAVLARLLALGADVGLQSAYGTFATHCACFGKQPSCLALLLDARASMDADNDFGLTPLMAAAEAGATDCVTLLMARLGDGAGEQLGMVDIKGNSAAQYACWFNQPSTLVLLLDAGASMNARDNLGRTPLILAAARGASDCVTLLLENGADALDLDAKQHGDWTALHLAAYYGHHQVVSLLLHAGADPTIRNNGGQTALQTAQARAYPRHSCITLLQAALAEPQRVRALFKARTLPDTAYAVRKARSDARDKEGLRTRGAINRRAAAAAPAYLRGRVAEGREPPGVAVVEQQGEEEKLMACLKYALGLEGGDGVVLFEGQEPAVGMLPEVFVELQELLVPKWDPARKGRPLGEGV